MYGQTSVVACAALSVRSFVFSSGNHRENEMLRHTGHTTRDFENTFPQLDTPDTERRIRSERVAVRFTEGAPFPVGWKRIGTETPSIVEVFGGILSAGRARSMHRKQPHPAESVAWFERTNGRTGGDTKHRGPVCLPKMGPVAVRSFRSTGRCLRNTQPAETTADDGRSTMADRGRPASREHRSPIDDRERGCFRVSG